MSRTVTYKGARDGLVHGAHYFNHRQQPEVDTWCGASYVLAEDRVREGIGRNEVITCLPCLHRHFRHLEGRAAELAAYKTDLRKIIEDNSVKAIQELEDAKAYAAITEEIAKTSAE